MTLTFFSSLLLVEKMINQLLLFDPFLFLVCLLERLRLRRFCLLKHAEIIPQSIVVPSKGLALARVQGFCVLKWRPIQVIQNI